MRIKQGVTRIIFIFRNVVIKIPNFSYSWKNFLGGLLSNMNEGIRYKYCDAKNKHLLCPVIWYSWGGWILVMAYADVDAWEAHVRSLPATECLEINDNDWHIRKAANERLYKKWIDAGLGGDDKVDNFGYYQNRLVKIDYP